MLQKQLKHIEDHHSFINNGTLYQLEGSLNGKIGRFEWIVQNNSVTHRMFVKGGGINGIPIKP